MNYTPIYNPYQNVDQTGSMVSAIGHKLTSGLRDFFQANSQWNEYKKQHESTRTAKSDILQTATALLSEKGLDPEEAGLSRFAADVDNDNVSLEDFTAKIGTGIENSLTIEKMGTLGLDTTKLKKLQTFPGAFKKEAEGMQATHLGKQISGGYGPDVYKAVQEGNMSLDAINQRFGTSITQEDYERIAGLQAPSAPAPKIQNPALRSGPIQGPQTVTDMDAARAAARAQKPMDYSSAASQTPIAKPMPYGQAVQRVAESGLSPEGQKTVQPILTSASYRQVAESAKIPDQTETGLYTDVAGKGMGVDETTKAIGGAMRAEDKLAAEKDINKIKQDRMVHQQDNIMFRELMKDARFKETMKAKYGERSDTYAADYFTLLKDRSDLEDAAVAASEMSQEEREYFRMKNPGKSLPEAAALRAKIVQYDREISRYQSLVPELSRTADKFTERPTVLTQPEMRKPGTFGEKQPKVKKKPMTAQDKQAYDFAVKNPNDSRSAAIMDRIKIKYPTVE